MKSLSVKAKLIGTLAILALSMLIVGLLGYRNSTQESQAMTAIFDNYFEAQSMLAKVVQYQVIVNNEIVGGAMSRSTDGARQMRQRSDELRTKIKKLMDAYEPTIVTPEERKLADDFLKKRAALVEQNNAVIALIDAQQYDQAMELYQRKSKPLLDAADATAEELTEFQIIAGRKFANEVWATAHTNNQIILLVIVSALGLAIVIGHLLTKAIVGTLNRAVTVAENIAGGRLDNDIHVDSQDELGRLLEALRAMDTKLSEIVGQVVSGANAVGSAAQQLAQGNDDLSSRTQEQASALEETASSMEEMTATVKQTADNARQANQLALSARSQADASGSVVTSAVSAMNEINTASRRIADIIGVIDEIAFQTNLLALNAAVEAARAGEQGRGFAVVASEVRNLAQRSASAAKEIKGLINDSVLKVADGTALVDQSGKALGDIVDGIKKLTDVVAEITSASQEQAAGIDQVNNAVTQMDQTTQENAALVEESASASKAMEHHAQELVELVGFFKTTRTATSVVPHNTPRLAHSNPSPRSVARPKPANHSASSHAASPMARASGDTASAWTEF